MKERAVSFRVLSWVGSPMTEMWYEWMRISTHYLNDSDDVSVTAGGPTYASVSASVANIPIVVVDAPCGGLAYVDDAFVTYR